MVKVQIERSTFVRPRCHQNLKFGDFMSLFCRLPQKYVLNCVLHFCVFKFSTLDIAFLIGSLNPVISSYTVYELIWKLTASSCRFVKSKKNPITFTLNFQVSRSSELNEKLMKQLVHSHLLDMRLVIANSALSSS